jgi:hypothetical protein
MTVALTNAEVMKLLDGWMVKYSPDQRRDEHGRWASVHHDPSNLHDRERLQHAATSLIARMQMAVPTLATLPKSSSLNSMEHFR